MNNTYLRFICKFGLRSKNTRFQEYLNYFLYFCRNKFIHFNTMILSFINTTQTYTNFQLNIYIYLFILFTFMNTDIINTRYCVHQTLDSLVQKSVGIQYTNHKQLSLIPVGATPIGDQNFAKLTLTHKPLTNCSIGELRES